MEERFVKWGMVILGALTVCTVALVVVAILKVFGV